MAAAGLAASSAAGNANRTTSTTTGSSSTTTRTGSTSMGTSGSSAASGSKANLFYANPTGEQDDLKLIKGIGPVIEKDLNGMGIHSYRQIADFKSDDITAVDNALDFPGRIERDEWIPQARSLLSSRGSAGSSTADASTRSGVNTGGAGRAGSGVSTAAGIAGGSAAVAGAAAMAASNRATGAEQHQRSGSTDQGDNEQFNLSAADLSSEIAERIKILNMRSGDSPRLNVSRDEFNRLAAGETANLSTSKLSSIVSILRWLCA